MYDYGCGSSQPRPDYMPYMQMMSMPEQYAPMVTMPQNQLESMYPNIYHMVYPAVKCHCDAMGIQPGMAFNPSKEQLDNMVENIAANLESNANIEAEMEEEEEATKDKGKGSRQPYGFYGGGYGYGGRRRFIRDLAGILLIRELLGRRYPYYYGYPVYGGFPVYGGYPTYGGYLGY